MIELRYVLRRKERPVVGDPNLFEVYQDRVLQYRQERPITGAGISIWTGWQDVPTVEATE